MIRLVQQRATYDCYVACMAMISGESYDAIMANLPTWVVDEMPTGGIEAIQAMKLMHRLRYEWDYQLIEPGTKWKPSPNHCILSVPSLNFEGKFHVIVWDGEKVFDPSMLKTYTTEMALPVIDYVIDFWMPTEGDKRERISG